MIDGKIDSSKLQTTASKLDSLKATKMSHQDSVRLRLQQTLELQTAKFNHDIDSLKNLNISPGDCALKMDSAFWRFREKVIPDFKDKFNKAGLKNDKRLVEIDSIVRKRSNFVDSLLTSPGLHATKLASFKEKFHLNIRKPSIDVPGLPSAVTNNITMPGLNTPKLNIPSSPTLSIPNANLPNVDAPNVNANVDVPVVDVPNIPSDNLSIDAAGQVAEQRAASVGELNQLQVGEEKMKTFESRTSKLKTGPDSLKSSLKSELATLMSQRKEKFQQDLKGLEKFDKFKSFADSRALPKRPPNEMKGKPFIERIMPSMTFQFFQRDQFRMDIAPAIGYRLSGHSIVGIGAYRRVTVLPKEYAVHSVPHYGFRFYTTYKFLQVCALFAEVDYLRHAEPTQRVAYRVESKPIKLNLGIQKRFQIKKGLYGYTIIMYDLMKIKRFPNTEGSAIRFGFDYIISKKQKLNPATEVSAIPDPR